jgi:hypothetical protein
LSNPSLQREGNEAEQGNQACEEKKNGAIEKDDQTKIRHDRQKDNHQGGENVERNSPYQRAFGQGTLLFFRCADGCRVCVGKGEEKSIFQRREISSYERNSPYLAARM